MHTYTIAKDEIIAMLNFKHPGIVHVYRWFVEYVDADFKQKVN